MPTQQEKLDFLNQYVRRRGYAHRTHRLLANHDLAAFQAMDPVPLATAIVQRTLSIQTKELLFIDNFACTRAPRYIIATHVRKALAVGVPSEHVLEAILLLLPEAGRTVFEEALLAWDEVSAGSPGNAPAGARAAPGTNTPANPPPAPPATNRPRSADMADASAAADDVPVYRRVLAGRDPAVLAALDGMNRSLGELPRSLDARTLELLHIIILTSLRGSPARLRAHMRRALALGCSEQEILEALEAIIAPAGIPIFEHGLSAWAEVVGAVELQPDSAPYSPG